MQSYLRKKGIIANVIVIINIAIVIGLIYIMNYFYDTIDYTVTPTTNIGIFLRHKSIDWYLIWGVLAHLALQITLYMMERCSKYKRLYMCNFCNLISTCLIFKKFNTFAPFKIDNMVHKYINADEAYRSNLFMKAWHISDALVWGFCFIVGFAVLFHVFLWLFSDGEMPDSSTKFTKAITVVMIIVNIIIFAIRGYNNLWYTAVGLISVVISWFIFNPLKKIWNKHGMTRKNKSYPGLLYIFILNYATVEDEDDEDFAMCKYTLDQLIELSEKMDKDGLDEVTKNKQLTMVIRGMRRNFDKVDEE